ncbi:Copper resistance protein [Paramixta manurensis]|uniref:Copper resistance protein n=1 Tax=Paramixta manurensis TaxID=2740817 RepID=A0A6M8UC99_9GAMM|nr:Copper resistance protein [Erwiniaceae bacterium PD-1]
MAKRYRIAKWFLALACLVILTCMAQRSAGLQMLQAQLSPLATSTVTAYSASAEAPVSPCELSAHSLLMAPPLLFESVLPALALLLAFLAMLRETPLFFPPPREFSSPVLRIHLRNCVFRE